jgi:hypothetical protein
VTDWLGSSVGGLMTEQPSDLSPVATIHVGGGASAAD